MKTLLAILFSLGLVAGAAWAQETTTEAETVPDAVSPIIEQVHGVANPLFVVTEVTETSQSLLGRDSFLLEFAGGADFGNAAQVRQLGEGNVTILQQYGRQNVASIRLEGDQNRVEALQDGVGNRLGVSVLGSYNTIPVSQTDGAELSLELINVDNLDLRPGIEQVGSGVPLMIQITRNPTP